VGHSVVSGATGVLLCDSRQRLRHHTARDRASRDNADSAPYAIPNSATDTAAHTTADTTSDAGADIATNTATCASRPC